MGSLPEGTLCAYCGINEAGYIPDGCVGPVCFDGENNCGDLILDGLWHLVLQRRLTMLSGDMLKTLAMRLPPRLDTVFNIHLLRIQVASYLFDA